MTVVELSAHRGTSNAAIVDKQRSNATADGINDLIDGILSHILETYGPREFRRRGAVTICRIVGAVHVKLGRDEALSMLAEITQIAENLPA